ncbi:MAG: hypothetical protein WD208_09575 [Dehalococcoidia bacterium]
MLKGTLVAFGIMLAAIPIPVVHYVAVPISPFLAGFVGGGIAKADESRILVFGLLVGGLMAIPAVVVLLAQFALGVEELLGINISIVSVLAIALVPYAWFGVTLGALMSYMLRASQRRREAQESERTSGEESQTEER